MRCEDCKFYMFYVWGYTDGSCRTIHSCKWHVTEDKEKCTLYEAMGDVCDH